MELQVEGLDGARHKSRRLVGQQADVEGRYFGQFGPSVEFDLLFGVGRKRAAVNGSHKGTSAALFATGDVVEKAVAAVIDQPRFEVGRFGGLIALGGRDKKEFYQIVGLLPGSLFGSCGCTIHLLFGLLGIRATQPRKVYRFIVLVIVREGYFSVVVQPPHRSLLLFRCSIAG